MTKSNLMRFPKTGSLLNDPFFRGWDDIFRPFGVMRREDLGPSGWMPAVDIRETDETYEFVVELPGLSKDDVDITVEDKVLAISGERKWADETDKNSYHRLERAYGGFTRTFSLPNAVDADKVKATFTDGLLNLSVPKAEEAKPRKIQIA